MIVRYEVKTTLSNGLIYEEFSNGCKYWTLDGGTMFHREDGPAIEYTDGRKRWYYQGELYFDIKDNKEWLRLMKMKALL